MFPKSNDSLGPGYYHKGREPIGPMYKYRQLSSFQSTITRESSVSKLPRPGPGDYEL